jgi:ArsR family transcriptional regulator
MSMEEKQALDAFGALSQATRLQMVRALVVAGPDGLAAGAVGEAVGASSSSVSFHLSNLERAGLVESRRLARSIVYSANYEGLSSLVEFLMRDCCQGRLAAKACCSPSKRAKRVG